MTALMIRRAEVDGALRDVRCRDETISEIGDGLQPARGERVLDAGGGALLPGLHDHHIHLLALAAARHSVRCGPPAVTSAEALAAALRAPPGSGWIRGVGYHESVAGPLDRARLDAWLPERPVRIAHRSGKMWFVNTAGARLLGLDRVDHPGIERDPDGRANGRLFRMDAWLKERLGGELPPLADTSAQLAGYGVTGLTDATPSTDAALAERLRAAQQHGELRQRLVLMGSQGLAVREDARLARGALKIILDDAEPPDLDALGARILAAHRVARSVAFHCVTRAELVIAIAALEQTGSIEGDRIEHAAVAAPDLFPRLSRLGVTVVTQPNFIAERGDAYRREVGPDDRPHLYRLATLEAHGIPVGAGTDAPFGDPDPWRAMRAAVERKAPSGTCLGAEERVSPERALALFTTAGHAPGGAPRRIARGAKADLVLLSVPWSEARERLIASDVRATVRASEIIFEA